MGIIEFGSLAVVYGALACLVVLVGLWLGGGRRHWHIWPLLFTTFTFLFLTQHPFPALDSLSCPVKSADPILTPFRFVGTFSRLQMQDAELSAYFTNRVLMASAMNYLLCVAIGLALARHTRSFRMAAGYGCVMTISVELTQLTGIWGLYPCAYRQFNVDDLILNATGVISGFALMHVWGFARSVRHQT